MKIFACYEGKNKQRIFTPDIYPAVAAMAKWRLLTCEKNNMTAFFISAGAGGDPRLASACQLRQTKIRIRYILQLIIIEIALAFSCTPKAACGW